MLIIFHIFIPMSIWNPTLNWAGKKFYNLGAWIKVLSHERRNVLEQIKYQYHINVGKLTPVAAVLYMFSLYVSNKEIRVFSVGVRCKEYFHNKRKITLKEP